MLAELLEVILVIEYTFKGNIHEFYIGNFQ